MVNNALVFMLFELVNNFQTGPNGPDQTKNIKFGLYHTRWLSAHEH